MADQEKVAISVRNIHKSFVLPQHKNTTFKQSFVNAVKQNKKTTQKVLNGIDVDIKEGEFFGIVGRNGSGKSTLLKLLAGIYAPDEGEIRINGKLTPFIELGVGFSPELSGRDNVYLNAALLGFNRRETDVMYDDIVEFAELEEHMDKKLKNFSSGMQVRLAFSIAVKAKNDILIFDEVLAVGDEAFQKKCLNVFEEYRRNKQTVILVTHSMENVRSLCTRALMLSEGKVEIIGSVKEVADAYQKSMAIEEGSIGLRIPEDDKHLMKLTGYQKAYYLGETLNVRVTWPDDLDVKRVGLAIMGNKNEYVFGSNTGSMKVGRTGMDYSVELNLGAGLYHLTAALYNHKGEIIELREEAATFTMYDDFKTEVGGLTRLPYKYTKVDKTGSPDKS